MKLNPKQLILAREYRGYSQTDLAKRIKGLSQSNLSKYEKGLDILSDDILMRIISFLEFPVDFFYKRISKKMLIIEKELQSIKVIGRKLILLVG